jgi:hypothetical protein
MSTELRHHKKRTLTPTVTPTATIVRHKTFAPSAVVKHHTITPSPTRHETSEVFREDVVVTPTLPPQPPLNTTLVAVLLADTVPEPSFPPINSSMALFEHTSSSSSSLSSSSSSMSGFIGVFAFMPVVLLGAWFLQGRIRRRWHYRSIPSREEVVEDEEASMRRL